MYVCNCNGISACEVKQAIRNGAREWRDVHAYYDCSPCCGKCECQISEAIAAARASEALSRYVPLRLIASWLGRTQFARGK